MAKVNGFELINEKKYKTDNFYTWPKQDYGHLLYKDINLLYYTVTNFEDKREFTVDWFDNIDSEKAKNYISDMMKPFGKNSYDGERSVYSFISFLTVLNRIEFYWEKKMEMDIYGDLYAGRFPLLGIWNQDFGYFSQLEGLSYEIVESLGDKDFSKYNSKLDNLKFDKDLLFNGITPTNLSLSDFVEEKSQEYGPLKVHIFREEKDFDLKLDSVAKILEINEGR